MSSTDDPSGATPDAPKPGVPAESAEGAEPAEVESPEVLEPPEVVEPGGADPFAALGGGFDLGSMVQMAQDMSAQMEQNRAELLDARVEGSSGGSLVTVVLNGHLHLVGLSIRPDAVDPDDPTVLEDLVVAAWRDAHDQVAQLQASADPLGGLGGPGGLDLGGLFGGQ